LPEFYNITTDWHDDDPLGFDIVMMDALVKGNFSSRLNHSCNPNCILLNTVSNGKYEAAIYAIKDIKQGEELVFNYHAVTDSI